MPEPPRLVYQERQFNQRDLEPFDIIPDELKPEYGVGIEYPPQLQPGGRGWQVADGMNKITQSLFILLMTPLGARFNQPDFGSMLPLLPMSAVNDAFIAEVQQTIVDAVDRWEPRVVLEPVVVDTTFINQNLVRIILRYRVKGVGTPGEFVLPLDISTGRAVARPATSARDQGILR